MVARRSRAKTTDAAEDDRSPGMLVINMGGPGAIRIAAQATRQATHARPQAVRCDVASEGCGLADCEAMADWSPLRAALGDVERTHTFGWQELDSLVGGLPRSAYVHSAFWKGARSGWPGFRTTDVRVGHSVTFARTSEPSPTNKAQATPNARLLTRIADVVLIGCVKTKRREAAPAKDLYISALFRAERAYAEASGVPWFILSALHGLVGPDDILDPYELRLSATSRSYRDQWGAKVVKQLCALLGPLDGMSIELHAGAAYTDPLRDRFRATDADVLEPLQGLRQGERLAWYRARNVQTRETIRPPLDAAQLAVQLQDAAKAQRVDEFLDADDPAMRSPGLYSWWVDQRGARDLTAGLGCEVQPGLIYAGLAGATRSQSGQKSTNTLRGRIRAMHLGGRHDFSTFRLSLGSILAAACGDDHIDEQALTEWMHLHLALIAVPVPDADTLDAAETTVLAALDPPLNLAKRPASPLRTQLSTLRKQYRRR